MESKTNAIITQLHSLLITHHFLLPARLAFTAAVTPPPRRRRHSHPDRQHNHRGRRHDQLLAWLR